MRSAIASDDEARGDRRAVIMQDRDEARRIDAAFVDQQRAHLGVAVLLDHEDLVVRVDEVDAPRRVNGKGAHPQRVEMDALRFQRASASSIAGAVEPK